MPKSLSGTNIAAQKILTAYSPVFLVEISADTPSASETYYIASKSYTLGAAVYSDLLVSIGDIEMKIDPGGGVAEVSDCEVVIRNEEDFSAIVDTYDLENDYIDIYIIFETGSETITDKLLLFAGMIHDIEFDWETFRLTCVDASLAWHRKIPRELADFATYPYIPLENANKELPIVFGSMNTGPFEKLGALASLAPALCVDEYSLKYIASKYAYSYNIPYVWFAAARRWGQVVDYTQSGAQVSIDSSKRYTEIRPIRALSTNDVTTWYDTRDADTTTGIAITTSDDLDLGFSGCPQLGTIYSMNISVHADAALTYSFSYVVTFSRNIEVGTAGTIVNGGNTLTDSSKSWVLDNWIGKKIVLDPGGGSEESHTITDSDGTSITIDGTWSASSGDYSYGIRYPDLTGSKGGSGETTYTISLDETIYGVTWDFENIGIEISTTTGSVTINEVWLAIYFYEQETGEIPEVYQEIEGYADVAAQYNDSDPVYSAGVMLENPAHVIAALFRDKSWGLDVSNTYVNGPSVTSTANVLDGWKLAFSLQEDIFSRDFVDEICKQTMIRVFLDYYGRLKMSAYDKDTACSAIFFADKTIAVENPDALPSDQRSSFRIRKGAFRDVYNTIALQYKKDYATGEYTAFTEQSGNYRSTGTAGSSTTGGAFTDGTATFETDGVAVDDVLYMPEDKKYTVTAVNSETSLTIDAVDGSENANTNVEYFIGPYFDYDCYLSVEAYKVEQTRVVKGDLIRNSNTADDLLDKFADYFVERPYYITFLTWFNAIDLEVGDFIYIEHDLLPTAKQPQSQTTLDGAISDSDTSVDVADGSNLRINDILLIEDELVKVTAVSTNTLTVTRAQSSTTAASHADTTTVYRMETKWEIIELITMLDFDDCAIRIGCREVPDSYHHCGRWAEDAVPAYDSASQAQKNFYGFWTYDTGEITFEDATTKHSTWSGLA